MNISLMPRRAAWTGVVALFLVAAACTSENEPATQETSGATSDQPIVLGGAVALSGWMSAYDVPAMAAAQLAIDDINAKGGVLGRPLKLIEADTKTEADQVANAGIQVIDEGADVMLISCDFDLGAAAAVEAQNNNMLGMSTCAGSAKFGPQGIGPLAFTMSNSTASAGEIMAEWAFEDQGWRTAYLLRDETLDYTQQLCDGFAQTWKSKGGTVVGEDTFQQGDQSIAPQITKFKSLAQPPDTIMLCSYIPGSAQALRQLRSAGVDVPVIGGPADDGSYWHDTVPNLKDFFFPAFASSFGNDPNPQVNDFFARLEKALDEPITSAPISGYSAVEAIAKAIEMTKSLAGDKLAQALETFNNVPLLIGPTTFTSEYHINFARPLPVMEVVSGGQVKVLEVRAPENPVPPSV